jgi:hypothetical protein
MNSLSNRYRKGFATNMFERNKPMYMTKVVSEELSFKHLTFIAPPP